MSFSIRKLEKLLFTKGFTVQNYFSSEDYIVYINVMNKEDFNTYLIYIPSKYEIKNENQVKNVFEIKPVETETDTLNIAENYTSNYIQDDQIDKKYEEINLLSIPDNEIDLENSLKENYDKPIVLKNVINYESKNTLKNIYNQISRLKNCTKNIKYKLSIIYKNYICSISRSDDINCFTIDGYKGVNRRQLFVTLDLETLYVKKDKELRYELKEVQKHVHKILNQTQLTNMNVLHEMLKKDILKQSSIISGKLATFSKNISEFEKMLEKLKLSEEGILAKIENVRVEYSTKTSFHHDITKTHIIEKYERELEDVDNLKMQINKNISDIRVVQDDLILETDQILFDNSIMINSVINNFSKLLVL